MSTECEASPQQASLLPGVSDQPRLLPGDASRHWCACACSCCPGKCTCRPPCQGPCCFAFRYVQPPKTRSLKPPACYMRVREPISDLTVSRLSYTPVCTVPQPPRDRTHKDALTPPESVRMECHTTTGLDYPYWGYIPPRLPIKPCQRRPGGQGCISEVTTTRESYPPPPICRRPKVEPPTTLEPPKKPMEGLTTFRSDFTPPACPHQRASFKPQRCVRPCEKFEGTTVSRMSYVPWPVLPKEVTPWKDHLTWRPPTIPFYAVSMYADSYLPPGWFIREPCTIPCKMPCTIPNDPCCVPCPQPNSQPPCSPPCPPPCGLPPVPPGQPHSDQQPFVPKNTDDMLTSCC